jgi:probable F420-dependent oxidoreductase
MRLGLHALGIGAGSQRAVIEAVARAAEPEHNPVIIAKQAASLDKLSGGRFTLGVGIGWSREEFDALGIPFERRGARTADYVAAMRTIWRDDIATHTGEFTNFTAIRVNPKPVRGGRVPVVLGGNSEAALRRVAQWGDGWYGFNLHDVDDAAATLATLHRLCEEAGRDRDELPADATRLAELRVGELVLVASPPDDPAQAREWVSGLAAEWQ